LSKNLPLRGAMDQDDDTLAIAALIDPGAFTCLYRRYVTRIYRYLFSRTGNSNDAEDLTAQVFAAAWVGLRRYRAQGHFAAWLFSIARNKANDHFRGYRSHLPLDKVVHRLFTHPDLLARVAHNEDLNRLAEMMAELDQDALELLRLRYAADLTYAEMAGLLRRSEGALKMAMSRLLARLREDWKESHEEKN
jgi:RNA polymerase sigma-70 factor, ECF subfamily